MFTAFVVGLHILVCVILVLMILLQSGKGADIGAVFGGGSSQTVFGSAGAGGFLSKVTIGAAVTFMLTSIVLSYYSGRAVPVEQSVVAGQSSPGAPAAPGPGEGLPEKVEDGPAKAEQPAGGAAAK